MHHCWHSSNIQDIFIKALANQIEIWNFLPNTDFYQNFWSLSKDEKIILTKNTDESRKICFNTGHGTLVLLSVLDRLNGSISLLYSKNDIISKDKCIGILNKCKILEMYSKSNLTDIFKLEGYLTSLKCKSLHKFLFYCGNKLSIWKIRKNHW